MKRLEKIPKLKLEKIPPDIKELLDKWQRVNKGYRILTYLAAKVFNIVRIPTYYDRTITAITKEDIDQCFNKLESLDKDIKILYEYTQSRLKEAGFEANDKITLYRNICTDNRFLDHNLDKCYISEKCTGDINPAVLAAYISYKKQDGSKNIDLEVDTLSSWSVNGADPRYGNVSLKLEVEVKNILHFNMSSDCDGPLETNEWIVVNDSNTGLIEFNLENDICISEKIKNKKNSERLEMKFSENDRKCAESYYRYRQLYLTPIAFNDIEAPSYRWYGKLINKWT